jgi:hypothetical protein
MNEHKNEATRFIASMIEKIQNWKTGARLWSSVTDMTRRERLLYLGHNEGRMTYPVVPERAQDEEQLDEDCAERQNAANHNGRHGLHVEGLLRNLPRDLVNPDGRLYCLFVKW